jgi:hypothetical protein
MPIKWNALMVSEAVDMVEEYVNQAIEPLEQAKLVATEARKIPNLPGYIDQHLFRLISEIERVTGGVSPWNQQPYAGNTTNSWLPQHISKRARSTITTPVPLRRVSLPMGSSMPSTR